jgi:hypothetical protein
MAEGHKNTSDNQTGGEKLFDWIAYQGIGWIANAGLGVATESVSKNKDAMEAARERVAENKLLGANPFKSALDQASYTTRSVLYNARQFATEASQNAADNMFMKDGQYKLADTRDVLNVLNQENVTANAAIGTIPKDYFDANGKVKLDTAERLFFEQYDKGFDRFAERLNAEGITGDTIKSARDNMMAHQRWRTTGKTVATAVAISAGGYAVMIPIKLMEDNKLPLVKMFDKVVDNFNASIGRGFSSEFDKQQQMAKREERYKEIEAEPKQTWASVLISRVVSVTPFYFIYSALASENNVISGVAAKVGGNEYSDPDKGFRGWEHHVGQVGDVVFDKGKNLPLINKMIPEEGSANYAASKNQFETLITDFTFSYLVANATYGMTRLFAPILGNNKNVPKTEDAHAATTPNNSVNQVEHVASAAQAPQQQEKTSILLEPRQTISDQPKEMSSPKATILTEGSIKQGAVTQQELQRI